MVNKMIKYEDYFYYDETSPSCLRWLVDRCRGKGNKVPTVYKGDAAGTPSGKLGHWSVVLKGKAHKVHKIILWLSGCNVPEGFTVDHEDRNPKNNKLSNLRIVPFRTNKQNLSKYKSNTSGVTGVSWDIKSRCGSGTTYAKAQWQAQDGTIRSKSFSVLIHGLLPAFKMAVMHRTLEIELLRSLGENYTESHGQ